MNEDTWTTVERWRAAGERVAVATVIRTYRSAPRPAGSVFAVAAGGAMAGSVSGGCVESAVLAEGLDLLERGDGPRLLHYGISDELAGDVGLACGGELWIALEELHPRTAIRRGSRVLAVTGPQAGRRLTYDADAGTIESDLEGALRDVAEAAARQGAATARHTSLDLDDGTLLWAEAVAPPPRLVVVGAVDTAEAVCRLAGVLGWRTAVVDPRARFATRDRLPSADEIVVAWPEQAYAAIALEPADAVVVLTHDPKVDDPALEGALGAGAGYVGALGSRRTQAQRRERLAAAGVPEEDVARIRGPVGLDIGAFTPAETAVSIVAEVIAERSGRAGAPLVETDGRIHPEAETADRVG